MATLSAMGLEDEVRSRLRQIVDDLVRRGESSQTAIAREAGIGQSHFNRMLSGERALMLDSLGRVCEVLGVSVSTLLPQQGKPSMTAVRLGVLENIEALCARGFEDSFGALARTLRELLGRFEEEWHWLEGKSGLTSSAVFWLKADTGFRLFGSAGRAGEQALGAFLAGQALPEGWRCLRFGDVAAVVEGDADIETGARILLPTLSESLLRFDQKLSRLRD